VLKKALGHPPRQSTTIQTHPGQAGVGHQAADRHQGLPPFGRKQGIMNGFRMMVKKTPEDGQIISRLRVHFYREFKQIPAEKIDFAAY